jgi:Asp-tRNA(Asn)/Glu-tRNA(Gln) amidotransferase A subunit family amidase
MPAGLTTNGLPVGLELDGLPGNDEALLGLGLSVEATLGRLPAPAMPADVSGI